MTYFLKVLVIWIEKAFHGKICIYNIIKGESHFSLDYLSQRFREQFICTGGNIIHSVCTIGEIIQPDPNLVQKYIMKRINM